jgi:hypothetical protein
MRQLGFNESTPVECVRDNVSYRKCYIGFAIIFISKIKISLSGTF